MALVSYVLVIVALVPAFPVVLFVVEILAAVLLSKSERQLSSTTPRPRVAVLVPAHNESSGLLPTLADIRAQLHATDRLLVVADNCSDDTADVARRAGAMVVERSDPGRRGKGYALAHGLDCLSNESPDIVIIIDADCRVAEEVIDRLATMCWATQRPVQALDLMIAPTNSSINLKVAEFAWRVKNCVRPLGLRALGLPCQLMGTGMAFPWALIRSVNVANASIVEDLKLGHDLALAGHAPVFCPSARVTSFFPSSPAGVQSQRLRWEQGHIGLIWHTAPRLIGKGIVGANWGLLALVLDLSVPPLSLLAIMQISAWILCGSATLLGFFSAALISSGSLIAFAIGVSLSWLKFGRDILPLRAVWSIASYVVRKVMLYGHILSRRSVAQWTRTDRKRS